MKKLYTLVALSTILSTIFYQSINAQSFANTYTAVRSGNWHTNSGPNVWDLSSEPPTPCQNCQIIIKSGVSVALNTSITISNGSTVLVGDGSGSGATLLSVASSGGSDFLSSFNIIMVSDPSNPSNTNTLVLTSSSSFINTSGAGKFDGVFIASTQPTVPPLTTYVKMFGNAPSVFNELNGTITVISNSAPAYQPLESGPKTLSSSGTLPIILSDFTATIGNEGVNLNWTTQLEQNSSHFTIQRSENSGSSWINLGTVTAKGNSATPNSYSFTDPNPGDGVNEYRLILVDLDGKYTYSPVKVVHTNQIASVAIFPNPARDYVNVNLGIKALPNLSIKLFNQAGMLLLEKQVNNTGGTVVAIPVSSYPSGNYLVIVTAPDGSRQVSKLFISK
jgi:hypothetical protein